MIAPCDAGDIAISGYVIVPIPFMLRLLSAIFQIFKSNKCIKMDISCGTERQDPPDGIAPNLIQAPLQYVLTIHH